MSQTFPVWIHTRPADHTIQEGSHGWLELSPRAYVGKALVLPSASLLPSLVIFHLGFPLTKHQLSSHGSAWEGKPMVRSWDGEPWGHPEMHHTAFCLRHWDLGGSFARWDVSALMPCFKCSFRQVCAASLQSCLQWDKTFLLILQKLMRSWDVSIWSWWPKAWFLNSRC